ncbi:energy-coupling factor transporter transmembrane component T [Cytobacillus sp. FSL R7-0696]|uniref:energy-coupling factor transporter transmembrane component T family protein n=1 Tax=Cytobacillus sp. FSL R7-0696 TaxID=2921691 RepID=UPI0030F4EA8D
MIHSLNPTMKAITVILPAILLSFSFDIITPAIMFIYILILTFFFSKLNIKKWLFYFIPMSFFALGLAWMTMLYTDDKYATGPIVFSFYSFDIRMGSIIVSMSLALRSLCFIGLSLLFAFTTDPTKFMLSLMQQVRLSPKLTYGILAGYRFVPTFKHELDLLKKAHRIRGLGRAKGWRNRVEHMRQYFIPLLAGAIRKAERVAIAMESKGFTGSKDRTYYTVMKIKATDYLFIIIMLIILIIAYYVSYRLGTLNIFGHRIMP